MSAKGFGSGAAQAAGQQLANQVLQTPQGQQALQATATGIAQGGAAAVGTALLVGQAASAATAAVVVAGSAVAVAAAPIVAMGAVGVGVIVGADKLWKWLNS